MAKKNAGNYLERKMAAMYAKFDVWQERVAGLLVILLLCVHPLYLTPQRYINLTRHKFTFFCICVGLALFLTLVIWVLRVTRSPRLVPRGHLHLADWAVLGFAIVTLLSAIFSPFKDLVNVWTGKPEPQGRYDGAITQLLYVATFFIVSRWYKPRKRDFNVFGIAATIVALLGVLQFYGMDFLKLWPNVGEYKVENFYRILFRSTLGNVDIVSTFVCVAILLNGFLFIRLKSKWQPLWLAASALNFWLMDLADAYSGRVGIAAAMLLSVPFIVENRKTLGRTLILGSSWLAVYTLQNLLYDANIVGERTAASLLPYAGAVAALLVAGVVLLVVGGKGTGARGAEEQGEPEADDRPGKVALSKWLPGVILIVVFIVAGIVGVEVLGKRAAEVEYPSGLVYELREVLHGNIYDELGTNRVYIWRNALSAYPNHPVIGSGPDTFLYAFPAEAHGRYWENYDKAHNEYIQILICQGILGLACYLVFLVSASIKAVPKAFQNPLVAAVLAAFIGYCVQAFFNISLPIASQMLWVLAAMLANKRFRDATLENIPG